jgi:hypothetical protein
MDPNSALSVSIASLAVVLNALPSVLLMEGPLACLASAQSMAQVTSASAGDHGSGVVELQNQVYALGQFGVPVSPR